MNQILKSVSRGALALLLLLLTVVSFAGAKRQSGPSVPQGGTGVFDATGMTPPATGLTWDILNVSGATVGSSNAPNGWGASLNYGVYILSTVTVTAPSSAPLGFYTVRINFGTLAHRSQMFQVITKPNILPPAVPTGLAATPGDTTVSLNWNASARASYYQVWRSPSSGDGYVHIFDTGDTSTLDTNLVDGTPYFYVVAAVNSSGSSVFSNEATATPFHSNTKPTAPNDIFATPGDTQVNLWWTPSWGASSYTLSRATAGMGPYTVIPTPAGATSFVDTGLTNGVQYFYEVSASNAYGTSANSNVANATPSAVYGAPKNLHAYPGNGQATLVWQAVPSSAGYNVKVSTTSGGPYTQVKTLTGTSWVDTGLTNGQVYYFVVTNMGPNGESANSNEASATPTTLRAPITIVPNPPTGYLPDALGLVGWQEHTIPVDTSDAPGGGPSSILGISLPFGVVESSSGADIVLDDPIVGPIGFSRRYRSALAAGNISSPGLPAGWTHNFDYRMVPQQPNVWGPIQLVYPNGSSETITPVVSGSPTGDFSVPTYAPYKVSGVPGSTTGQWTSITVYQNGLEQQVFTMDPGDSVYRLHTLVNAVGSQTNLTYVGGALTSISSSSLYSDYTGTKQKSMNLTYSSGLLYTVGVSDIGSVSYGYSNGELASVTSVDDGHILWSYGYTVINGVPYLSSTGTEGSGATANITFDPVTARANSLTDGNNYSHFYTYGANSSTSVMVGANVDNSQKVYDANGKLSKSIDAAGNVTSVVWQGGDLMSVNGAQNQLEVYVTRDAAGNPTKVLYPHNNYTQYTWAYPAGFPQGQLTKEQEFGADGTSMAPTTYQYFTSTNFSLGQVTGNLSSVTYPSGQVLSYAYTPLGQIQTVTTKAVDGATTVSTQVGYTATNQSERLGRPTSITDPNGNQTKLYIGDTGGGWTDPVGTYSSYSTNKFGQLTGLGNVGGMSYNFDYAAPSKALKDVTAFPGQLGGVGELFAFGLDAEFSTWNQEDPNQHITLNRDAQYNLQNVKNGNGVQMHTYTWDPFHLNGSYTIGWAGTSDSAVYTSQLDVNGNLSTFTGPNYTGSINRSADGLVNAIDLISSSGQTYSQGYLYDGFGRVKHSYSPEAVWHDYIYDSAGRVTQDTFGDNSVSYTYAANGARLSMNLVMPGISYQYFYSYDKNNRVTEIDVSFNGYPVASVKYAYDANGRVIEVDTPQIGTFYKYDGGGRVTQLQNLTPAGVVDDSNVQPVVGPDKLQHSVLSTFGVIGDSMSYDGNNNLLGFNYQVRQSVGSYYTGSVDYQFASGHNIGAAIVGEKWLGFFPASLAYGTDGCDNVTELRGETFHVDNHSDQFTGSTTIYKNGIQYDPQGNMTQFRNVSAVWNLNGTLNQIKYVTTSDVVKSCRYDADGRLMVENVQIAGVGSYGELFSYDGDALIAHNGTAYVWGPTGPVLEVYGDQSATFTYDPNGSLVNKIHSVGLPEEPPELLDAYGCPITPLGTVGTQEYCPFLYKGQAGYVTDFCYGYISDCPLVYCHHRWYDPKSGRWISRDPAGLEGGENLYEFCNGNPLTLADPSGLDSDPWWLACLKFGQKYLDYESSFHAGVLSGLTLGHSDDALNAVGAKYLSSGWAHESGSFASWFVPIGEVADVVKGAKWCQRLSVLGKDASAALTKGCFVAGTQILLADGSSKPIDSIRPGDRVLTRNESGTESAQNESRCVLSVNQHDQAGTVVLSLSTGGTVECTPDHPFYVINQGFTPAGHLKSGDKLAGAASSKTTQVIRVDYSSAAKTVYNFEVEGDHTYFVRSTSGSWLWVHNQCYTVYISVEKGAVEYVGFTKRFLARQLEHLAIGRNVDKIVGLTNLTYDQARGVEQALIDFHGLAKNGGTLSNLINSIHYLNPKYEERLLQGFELLRKVGYMGF